MEGLVLLAFIFDLRTTTTAGSVRVNSEANAVYCAPSIIMDWNIQPLATPSQPESYFESYNWEQSLNADATDMKRHVTENWWMKITKKEQKRTKTKKKHLLGSLETGEVAKVITVFLKYSSCQCQFIFSVLQKCAVSCTLTWEIYTTALQTAAEAT